VGDDEQHRDRAAAEHDEPAVVQKEGGKPYAEIAAGELRAAGEA
jgi:hypothetical protein